MTSELRDCPDCGLPREFSQHHPSPEPCPDSADGRCPEWFCASCGAGLLVGLLPVSRDLVAVAAHPAARQLNRVA